MTVHRYSFVTGGTGFLGRHFIYRLLESGQRVIALVRGDEPEHARARLISAVDAAARSYGVPFDVGRYGPSLEVERGDITQAHGGLDAAARARWAGKIGDVWHIAASLKFEDEFREEIHRLNVGGTTRVLDIAEGLEARRFFYLSTAYTCGRRAGDISESAVEEGSAHNNYYEVSKTEAERAVARRCEAAAIEWRILRPSIVIGPAATHHSGGSVTGMYGFVREVLRLREVLVANPRRITLAGDGRIPLDLVPVDSVVADMLELRDRDAGPQRFYHLTNPRPPRLLDVVHTICDVVGVRRFQLVPDHEPRGRLERKIDEQMVFYRSYFRNAKAFERCLPDRADVSVADLEAYVRSFIEEHSPAPSAHPTHATTLPA